jgi:glutamate synthase domain-containing protein 3
VRNPFYKFRGYQPKHREIPLDNILRSKRFTMETLINGYNKLLEEEIKGLVWLVEHSRLVEAYARAEELIKDMEYTQYDIEEFCHELERGDKIRYSIVGPAGIYISALCNHAREEEIILNLDPRKGEIHLIGYRLKKGRRILIDGDTGDFTGVGLSGGEIVVQGSCRNWTGAGMRSGKILIKKDVGYHTGEWMMGGEIWVEGRIKGIGKAVNGKIYAEGNLVYPGSHSYRYRT